MSGSAGTAGGAVGNGNGTGNGQATDWKIGGPAALVAGLRELVKPPPLEPDESCDLCQRPIPHDHRHLLHLEERRILCVCGSCWALRSGDADLRPTGTRVLWLEDFTLPGELWAGLEIPIGLAFLFISGSVDRVVGMYPSPAGATECELYLDDWDELKALNPVLEGLGTDVEALVINRLADPSQYAIAPIDKAYELVGLVKSKWEGISGGAELKQAVVRFFEGLKAAATN